MIADIFYTIFTLTITISVCFTRKKVKLFRGFSITRSPRHRPRPPGGAYSSPPEPQLQSVLAFPKTDAPIFFLHYPLKKCIN